MEARDEPDGSLVLDYDSTSWGKRAFAVAVLLLGTAAYDRFIGPRGTDRLLGLLGSAATFVLIGLAQLEQAHVVVDPDAKRIVWTRRWGFRRRAGTLAFDEVTAVLATRPIGDDGVPSRRISLRIRDGREVPLTVGYRPDGDGQALRIAERIRSLLGQAGMTPLELARPLVDAGRTIDAIKLLRDQAGLSLTEAKRQVDALATKRGGG